jgi:hypothetical protein
MNTSRTMLPPFAVRNRSLVTTWASQVLSAIGDQLFGLAIMWIAVQKFGSDGALVAASETCSARLCIHRHYVFGPLQQSKIAYFS